MRYAIVTDLHANHPALAAVARAIRDDAPDQVVCCGDVVGYGAEPNACCHTALELLGNRQDAWCVLGNHDHAAVGGDTATFVAHAARAALWTREVLEPELAAWLQALPYVIQDENLLLVHGSAQEPDAWHYAVDRLSVLDCTRAAWHDYERRVVLTGHTHIAHCSRVDRDGETVEDVVVQEGRASVTLGEHESLLVNAGSVGQPRDQDPRASYALLDIDGETITTTIQRVAYDITAAQQAIHEAGLPSFLAQRLESGH